MKWYLERTHFPLNLIKIIEYLIINQTSNIINNEKTSREIRENKFLLTNESLIKKNDNLNALIWW